MKKIIFYIFLSFFFIAFSALAADVEHTGSATYSQNNNHTNTGAITIDNSDTHTNLGAIDIDMRIDHVDNADLDTIANNNPNVTLYGIKDGSNAGDKQFINQGSITIDGSIYYDSIYGIYLSGNSNNAIRNTATGDLDIDTRQAGITFGNGNDIFDNQGSATIISISSYGVTFGSGSDTFKNAGDHYVSITSAAHGIAFGDGDNFFENTGNSINITTTGSAAHGILAGAGDDNATNSGVLNITASGASSQGINLGNGANIFNNAATGDTNITANANGIAFGTGADNLSNQGKLDITTPAGVKAINTGAGNDTVTLAGDVNTTGGLDGGADTDTLTLTGTIDSSIDGTIANFETINKEGAGIWRLNGGAVTGTATDNFNHKRGTLYLGNNNLSGNYTQSPGSTLLINVTKTTADLLNVKGTGTTADITDGILLVRTKDDEIWDEDGVNSRWKRWTEAEANTFGSKLILDATALTGKFAKVKSKSLLFYTEADYSTANEVSLNITRGLTVNELQNKSSMPVTANQLSIGNWLENAINLNINKPLISALIYLSEKGADAVKQAINTLSPEPVSGSITAGRAHSSAQHSNLSQRLNAYHKAGSKAEAARLSAGLASNYFPIMYANPAQKEISSSLWIKTSYLNAKADPDDQFKFDMDTQGVTMGADAPFGNFILGASAGYSATNVEYDTVVSEGDIQTLSLNLYSSYKAKNYFIDGVLSYSNHSSDTTRKIEVGTLKETAESDYDANEYGVYLNFGYPFAFNNGWTITPNASLQYSKYEQDAFMEKSASNSGLRVSGTDTDSIASGLGFSVEKVMEYPIWKIIPSLSVLWKHEFADASDTIEANFLEFENELGTFKIEGYDQSADTFASQLGITVYNGANTELFLNYDLGVKKDFIANSVTAGLKFHF